ncbi:MAG TPA: NAD-dependent epimerase/dehydratase family protein [Sandaracinaceae bacterium LLY-WYZ-13_1]|nr:NAD-dependent epimerase/dehydratase family protein [Sandaracinaceae bacterium LLY-WYZ-13_1]
MGRHVFITGLAGFLGSHLAERLLELGCSVSGCDDLSGGYRDNVPEGAELYEVDCCDLDAMKRITRGAEVVVHTAAAAHEGLSVFSPTHIVENNVQASVATFTAAIASGAERVVYCSSMARYGDNPVPFVETMPVRPRDPYGIAKVASEQLLDNLARTHGLERVVAVPHNIVGARQKYDDPYRNVASIMANLMLQGRQPFIYGDGTQKRCFSPVQDVVDCLVKLVLEPGMDGLTVNVGPDEGFITINELAERLAAIVGFEPLEPIYVEDRPCEVKLATCAADLAREKLGYAPKRSLDDGLRDIVEFIRARGPRPFDYAFELEIVTDDTPRTWKDRLL